MAQSDSSSHTLLSDSDRERILATLNDAEEQLLALVEDLPTSGWKWKPAAGSWSVGEVVEHLVLAEKLLRSSVERALEKGHSMLTSSLLDEAMERFMPKQAPMDRLAEAVVIGRSQDVAVAVCDGCGLTAKEPDPAVCTVCSGTEFQVLSAGLIQSVVDSEGGAEDEPSYDGRTLRWTEDARKALHEIPDAYVRRRTKARHEKSTRFRKLNTWTPESAGPLAFLITGGFALFAYLLVVVTGLLVRRSL